MYFFFKNVFFLIVFNFLLNPLKSMTTNAKRNILLFVKDSDFFYFFLKRKSFIKGGQWTVLIGGYANKKQREGCFVGSLWEGVKTY